MIGLMSLLAHGRPTCVCGGRDKLDDIGADTVDVVTESLKSAGNSCCFLIAITVSMSGKLASCRFLTKIEEAGYLMPRPL